MYWELKLKYPKFLRRVVTRLSSLCNKELENLFPDEMSDGVGSFRMRSRITESFISYLTFLIVYATSDFIL